MVRSGVQKCAPFLFGTLSTLSSYTIMKATIDIPESLNELTLGQYQEFLIKSKGLEGYKLAQCTVEVFCSLPRVSVLKISLIDITSITASINALFENEQQLQTTFKIENQEFGFINDIENMSLGEYSDCDKYITDWEQMHRTMAVLYRPIINKVKNQYTITDYEGTSEFADLMRFMPLDVVFGSLVFFYHLGNELLKATQSYLVEETVEMIIAQQPNSGKSGVGTAASTHYLRETLEGLTKLPEFQLPKLSLS